MNKICLIFFIVFSTMLNDVQAENASALKLIQKIPLSNVKGRIDHLAIDLKGERLFVAALGNNTLEVIDLKAGKQIHTITGLSEPQGVIFIPNENKIYISNGGNGKCSIFDASSFDLIDSIEFNEDADNMRYDSTGNRTYVGYGSGGIGIIDSISVKRIGNITLPAHPEAFEIEHSSGKVFINIPVSRQIAVVDIKKLLVEAEWQLKDAGENFPMALDEVNHHLFVGCWSPAKLLIFDTQLGKIVSEINIDNDADDIFYDAGKKRIYISSGKGFLDIVEQQGGYRYSLLERMPTAQGARTSLFVPESGRLYLAVPAYKDQQAEIWVYGTK